MQLTFSIVDVDYIRAELNHSYRYDSYMFPIGWIAVTMHKVNAQISLRTCDGLPPFSLVIASIAIEDLNGFVVNASIIRVMRNRSLSERSPKAITSVLQPLFFFSLFIASRINPPHKIPNANLGHRTK